MTFGAHKLVCSEQFWTTHTNFDDCCQRYTAACEKIFIQLQIYVLGRKLLRWTFSNHSAIYTKWGAQPFRRFLEFMQFLTAISRKLWRHLATKIRTLQLFGKADQLRKMVKKESKSTHKPLHNTWSKYAPLERTARRRTGAIQSSSSWSSIAITNKYNNMNAHY